MDYFPAFINLRDKQCLVVGGGSVAARKIELLEKCAAKITVISPTLSDSLASLHKNDRITWLCRKFNANDVSNFFLIISATNDSVVNRQVYEQANSQQKLVNVVDAPELCNFIVPAIIDRSPIVAAISSGGASPVLARILKAKMETLFPRHLADLGDIARRYRERAKQKISDIKERRRFWETMLKGVLAEYVERGQIIEAEQHIERSLAGISAAYSHHKGQVALVGAGPGDPELLTLKALRLMQETDCVVYDRLVSDSVMQLVRKDAERIYVGKANSNHSKSQSEINQILVEKAKQGLRVVRLKGGDPFIFGRGGEEIETLMNQGVTFQVVPGITAASGCSSYAGIPLTHRDYAQSCTFVTGHQKDGSVSLPWQELVHLNHTLVIYMGLLTFSKISAELIHNGCNPDLPAALVEQGTTQSQRVIVGTVESLPGKLQIEKAKSPALIIIGEVVALREQLAWFGEEQISN